MPLEKNVIGHRGMASPAQKSHISLECYLDRLGCLVRNFAMTHQTYRLTVVFFNGTLCIYHTMRVYPGIEVFIMTAKTDLGPACIGTSPQKFRLAGQPLVAMNPVTRQASHLAVKQREVHPEGILKGPLRPEIYRMVVLVVMVAVEADGRRIDPFRKQVALRNF